MYLNYVCKPGGQINISLWDDTGTERLGNIVTPLEGDAAEARLEWNEDACRAINAGRKVNVNLSLSKAAIYAYELRPLG